MSDLIVRENEDGTVTVAGLSDALVHQWAGQKRAAGWSVMPLGPAIREGRYVLYNVRLHAPTWEPLRKHDFTPWYRRHPELAFAAATVPVVMLVGLCGLGFIIGGSMAGGVVLFAMVSAVAAYAYGRWGGKSKTVNVSVEVK